MAKDARGKSQSTRTDRRVDRFLRTSGVFIPSSAASLWTRLERDLGHDYRVELEDVIERRAAERGGDVYEVLFRNADTALLTASLSTPMLREWLEHYASQDLPDGDVLDLACGSGLGTMFYATMRPGSRVVGVDTSAAAVATATEIAERLQVADVSFQQADVSSLALDRRFATVVSTAALRDVDLAFGSESKGLFSTVEEVRKALASGASVLAEAASRHLEPRGRYVSLERLQDEVETAFWVGALADSGLGTDLAACSKVDFTSPLSGRETMPAITAGPDLSRPSLENVIDWTRRFPKQDHDDLANELEFKRSVPLELIDGWHVDIQDEYGQAATRLVLCRDAAGHGLLYLTTSRGHRNLLGLADAGPAALADQADQWVKQVELSPDVVDVRMLAPSEFASL